MTSVDMTNADVDLGLFAKTLAAARFNGFANDNGPTLRIDPFVVVDPATIPRRAFLYGKHFVRGQLSMTVSPGGIGKSSLSLVESLAMCTGRPLLGESPKERLSVLYVNGEDDETELRRRVQAAMLHYKISQADIGDRLFIHGAEGDVFTFAREDRDGVRIIKATSELLIQIIEQNQIDVVTLDPFISFHTIDGNTNKQMQPLATEFKRIAKATGVAFELIAHTRKGVGRELNQDDALGAVALVNKTRSTRVLNAMTPEEATKAHVDTSECGSYFKVSNPKNNLASTGGSVWRRMIGVSLCNGGSGNMSSLHADHVGVATPWNWPTADSLSEAVTPEHLAEIKRRLTGLVGRESRRSPEWAGCFVLDVLGADQDDKAERARAESLLKAWLKSGDLTVTAGEHPSGRRATKYIIST